MRGRIGIISIALASAALGFAPAAAQVADGVSGVEPLADDAPSIAETLPSSTLTANDLDLGIDDPALRATLDIGTPHDSVPWRNTFTWAIDPSVGDPGLTSNALDAESLEFGGGANWGFTLGFEGGERTPLNLDGVRAGAFMNVTPRVRIGGELSFLNPEGGLVPGETSDELPELKLNSKFKF